jgi:tetratricopeptide (TPR) repeat protein
MTTSNDNATNKLPPWYQDMEKAVSLHSSGQTSLAKARYQEILAKWPNNSDALHLLGVLDAEANNFAQALDYFNRAIIENPRFGAYYLNRGFLHYRERRFVDAVEDYQQAVLWSNPTAQIYLQLGDALLAMHHFDRATHSYSKALELEPNNAKVLHQLGTTAMWQNHISEAIHYYEAALSYQKMPETLTNLAVAYLRNHEVTKALAILEQSYQDNPQDLSTLINLSLCYDELGQYNEAIKYGEEGLSKYPNDPSLLLHLASSYKALGQFTKALACLEKIPNNLDAQFNRSLINLVQGNYLAGWQDYEARLGLESWQNEFHYPKPRWRGEDLSPSKQLLVYAEQGLGDTIQALRYIKQLPRPLVISCQPELQRLIKLFAPDVTVVRRGESVQQATYQIPCMSLPGLFATTTHNIPDSHGYITASMLPKITDLNNFTSNQVPNATIIGGKRIGIVWHGSTLNPNDAHRSIALTSWQELLSIPVHWYSLQKGDAASQAKEFPNIVDLSAEISDFVDLASFMTQLDLIITVDTAAAHLGGALGIPTWVLVPFVPDWRWGYTNDTTPWYDSIKLFRQQKPGNWQEVFHQVQEQLLLEFGGISGVKN